MSVGRQRDNAVFTRGSLVQEERGRLEQKIRSPESTNEGPMLKLECRKSEENSRNTYVRESHAYNTIQEKKQETYRNKHEEKLKQRRRQKTRISACA